MSKTGLNRDTSDKFYTKQTIANYFISKWKDVIKPEEDCFILEPSAGNGSFFIPIFNEYKYYIIGYDIEPENTNIIKCDFLEVELPNVKDLHFIGNPPFGRQSSLAKKFIKKCAKYGESITFILPKSFKKDSFQKAFPLEFHLVYEEDVPENGFVIDGKDYNVECVFQIWKRMNNKRQVIEDEDPYKFSFVKKEEDPQFSLRRVGVYAGKISTETENKSSESHYFIKLCEDIDQDTFEEEFLKIEFTHNNTVGPKSISKQEFIKKINIIISSIE
jgi:hypothetical protein